LIRHSALLVLFLRLEDLGGQSVLRWERLSLLEGEVGGFYCELFFGCARIFSKSTLAGAEHGVLA
jgi:hypothetical protein